MLRSRIYMDYAAIAPELPVVRRALTRARKFFANPSSIHTDGIQAARALTEARTEIADILHARSSEIVFCGSGTESDNLAIMGVFKHVRLNQVLLEQKPHIITTEIEHPAVLEACRHVEAMGAHVTYLSVGIDGRIDLKELRSALRPETILVSIAYANNEIGVIQPVREIAKEIRHFKKNLVSSALEKNTYPLFHTDACQAAAYCNMNVEQLGVDLLTLGGAKLGGPRGTAILYVRTGTPIAPMFYGGGQESGLRSGTENSAGAIGLAAALKEAEKIKDKECTRLTALRTYCFQELRKAFPTMRSNGSEEFRLPNNVHISFPNIASELLVLELDAKGISCSAGSACSSAKDLNSHVVEALYSKENGEDEDAKKWGSIRLSFGRTTTKKEIQSVLSALKGICKKYTAWNM